MSQPWRYKVNRDPLDRKVWFGNYAGQTFAYLIEHDQDYAEWVLYESDLELDPDLVSRMEEALEAIALDEDWED